MYVYMYKVDTRYSGVIFKSAHLKSVISFIQSIVMFCFFVSGIV